MPTWHVWPTRSQYRNQVTNGVHIQNTLSIIIIDSLFKCYHVWKLISDISFVIWQNNTLCNFIEMIWRKKATLNVHHVDSIQFNSKALFIDGDPVSLQLIFPGVIQICEQYNKFSSIYTKQHMFIGQTQANTTYTFIQIHFHNNSYLTYTIYNQSINLKLHTLKVLGHLV